MTQLSRWFRRDKSGDVPVRRETTAPTYQGQGAIAPTVLRDEIDRFFDDFFGNFFEAPLGLRRGMPAFGGGYYPALDIVDRDDSVDVYVELPGLDEQDVEVSVTDGGLTIRGEKKQEFADEGIGWARAERSYGAFQRTIPLPTGVDADKTRATFTKGVLRVCLPKTEPTKARRVPIEANVQTGQAAQQPAGQPQKAREKEPV